MKNDELSGLQPPLHKKHIRNCRLIEDRYELLKLLPKNAICAEVGIMYCDFSQKILDITKATKLHLFDFEENPVKIANDRFAALIKKGTVQVHLGDSSTCLLTFPENYFDWVYIDGDHRYNGVMKDLEAARTRVKPQGHIVMNDYQYFSIVEFMKYGVIEAVNEFCIKYDYEILYLALQGRMFCDVVLKKIG